MGICKSRTSAPPSGLISASDVGGVLPPDVLPSEYQQRLTSLVQSAETTPPPDALEMTLRKCIAFCYGGGPDWAPHVRVTVYADNPAEHQSNVTVYDTILCTWGVPGFEAANPPCRPIPYTDVEGGHVRVCQFWTRIVPSSSTRRVRYRDVAHQLLHWFLSLPDGDARRQLLVNVVLQLHEACYNCIGRHKEVFEYCIYDLIEAEAAEDPDSEVSGRVDVTRARLVVQRHAAHFLDRHKRGALHAATLSPLKFLFQNVYEVFENLDSHGASFWDAMLCHGFFPGLQMPYESIVELDKGWTWGAVDFLPLMSDGDAFTALARFASPENIGRDWRTLSRGLRPPVRQVRRPLPGLPRAWGPDGLGMAIREVRRPGSGLRRSLEPYAVRFAAMFSRPVLAERCAVAFITSPSWDLTLGPALAALSEEALGQPIGPSDLRVRLLGDCTDAAAMRVDVASFSALLHSAGVKWTPV